MLITVARDSKQLFVAMKSLLIIFAFLLVLSPVFAKDLKGEKPEEENPTDDQHIGDDKHFLTGPYGRGPGPFNGRGPNPFGGRPGPFGPGCRYYCGPRCCPATEYADHFSQTQMDGFQDEKQYGYGPRPGYGYGPRPGYGPGPRPGYGYGPRPGFGCRYRCGFRCCAAEEYADYMLAQSQPQN